MKNEDHTCDHCILHNIQNNLQGYYFELVKKHKG